ncbi:MAG: hypothetical protein C5B54_10220 [Acidobacteria bacterium]|nr:MAG: hypothetical protein C5B54_10220 [Acidobacteriota bacterium]
MRASSAYQCSLCPRSDQMQRGLKEIETPESRQGTRLHSYRAHPDWERRLLSPDEQDLLRMGARLEREIFATINLSGDAAYIEHREAAMEWGDGLVTGHPDLMRIYPELDITVVIDEKYGWVPVPPADVNLQLRCYAIMAPTRLVYVAISQPRLPAEDRITIARYDEERKKQAEQHILSILRASQASDAPLIAGEEQCRYCLAKAICPALAKAVTMELAFVADLAPDFAPELSKAKVLDVTESRLAQASDTQLGQLLTACALAFLVSTPLKDEIRRRIAAGEMKGYTLGKEAEVRTITEARSAISLLVLGRALKREEILALCDLPLQKIEHAYRKASGASAKEARAEINRLLADVIEIEKRKPRILKKNEH